MHTHTAPGLGPVADAAGGALHGLGIVPGGRREVLPGQEERCCWVARSYERSSWHYYKQEATRNKKALLLVANSY